MRILITGGTGFIGRHITAFLREQGHQIVILSRNPAKYDSQEREGVSIEPWPDSMGDMMNEVDAVVNLAGENLFSRRWTPSVKRRILESRIKTTQALTDGFSRADAKPKVLVSASAAGYYGSRGRQRIKETMPPGEDFLAVVCRQWEAQARKAEKSGIRVAIARFGLAMHPDGGVLSRLIPPFRFGVGGPLGSGRQFLPWIHVADLCHAIIFLLTSGDREGPFNVAAPAPVTMRWFCADLGRAMHRPSWLPVPSFLLDLILGEAAGAITASLRIVPQKLLDSGFTFRFPELKPALQQLLRGRDGT